MSKNRDLNPKDPLPANQWDALNEFVSMQVTNLELTQFNNTTIQAICGAGDRRVAIAVDGKWRYREATVQRAHPGGAAADYDIYVTASANVFVPDAGGEIDNTDYKWDLAITASGVPPAAVAHYRKIGVLKWDGAKITRIRQTADRIVNSRIDDHAIDGMHLGVGFYGFRRIFDAGGYLVNGIAQNYALGWGDLMAASGVDGPPASAPKYGYINEADLQVTPLLLKARVKALVHTNSVASGVDFTVGCNFPASAGGAANVIKMGFVGATGVDPSVKLNKPAANLTFVAIGAEVDFVHSGNFLFVVTPSGAMAAGAVIVINAHLEVRYLST